MQAMVTNRESLNKVYKVLEYQFQRYTHQSQYLLITLIIYVFYFGYYPDLLSLVWPSLLETFPQIPLFIGSLISINILVTIFYNSLMYLIYKHKWPFFQQFRISDEPWPWELNYQQWRINLRNTLKTVALNVLVVSPIVALIDCKQQFLIRMKIDQVPQSKFTYIWQFLFFLFMEQLWVFLTHALIHHPKLYWIHKKHHEYKVVASISGQYIHPIQYVFSSLVSAGIGYKILAKFFPVHVFSVMIWTTFRSIEPNDTHCGYNWPWCQIRLIPFNSGESYHFYHHRVNIGNYGGVLYIFDSLFGSNQQFWDYEQKIQTRANSDKKIIYGKQN